MNRARAALAALMLVFALAGCSGPDVRPVNGGPPVGPVTAPGPPAVDWANSLCTTLNPLFTALEVPTTGAGGTVDTQTYVSRIASARAALRGVDARMHTVGAAPADDGLVLIDRVSGLLDELGTKLDAAAKALGATPTGDGGGRAIATARDALRSFDRDAVTSAMMPDPAIQNAFRYAPACVRG